MAARKRLADKPLSVNEGEVESVGFSPDGKTIAAGFTIRRGGGGVVLWDTATRKRLVDEPLRRERGQGFERGLQPRRQDHRGWIRDSRGIGSASGVVLWDLAARKRLVDEPLSVKEGDVESVAFSPDGKTIAAGLRRRSRRRRRGAVGRGRTQTPGRRATPREGGHR